MAAVAAHSRPSRLTRLLGSAAAAAGTTCGHILRALPTFPGFAGAAMVSYGAAMIYRPAGVIAGGAFLLWFGTELNRRQ